MRATAKKPAPSRPGLRKQAAVKLLLKERAYEDLKRRIQDSTFPPGEFLSERQLAARMGMSKTPIKAALERLALEGFVTISPQQGIVVREPSIHEIADQFEIRVALESFVARSLAGKLNRAQLERLKRNLRENTSAVTSRDVRRCVELDAEFHSLLCEFHGNQEVVRVMGQLREKIHRIISRVLSLAPDRTGESVREHAAILKAIQSGDAERAARQVIQHLEYGKQFLLSPRRTISS